jgi:hypothetical protein
MAIAIDPSTTGTPASFLGQTTRINTATTTNFGQATITGYICAASTSGTFQFLDNAVAITGAVPVSAGGYGVITIQGANNLQVTTTGTIDITFTYVVS